MVCYKSVFFFIQLLSVVTICLGDEASVTTKPIIVGGRTVQDPANPVYMDLAKKSVQKFVTGSGITTPLELIQINKVETQVVAGYKTYIDFSVSPSGSGSGDKYNCMSTILEQPWLKVFDIDVTCNLE